jgi:hypothetical protein
MEAAVAHGCESANHSTATCGITIDFLAVEWTGFQTELKNLPRAFEQSIPLLLADGWFRRQQRRATGQQVPTISA